MKRLVFAVQGSAAEPYSVVIEARPEGLRATCTCAAGQMGQPCKHRIAILCQTSGSGVPVEGTFIELSDMLVGTPLQTAIDRLIEAETMARRAAAAVTKAKQELKKAMIG